MRRHVVLLGLLACLAASAVQAQPTKREAQVLKDKERVESLGLWIYNDLPRGIAEAKKSGKPLLVVFRCIPCENCAQLDEQVVEHNPAVRAVMEKFICVRVVYANGWTCRSFSTTTINRGPPFSSTRT